MVPPTDSMSVTPLPVDEIQHIWDAHVEFQYSWWCGSSCWARQVEVVGGGLLASLCLLLLVLGVLVFGVRLSAFALISPILPFNNSKDHINVIWFNLNWQVISLLKRTNTSNILMAASNQSLKSQQISTKRCNSYLIGLSREIRSIGTPTSLA